MVLNLHSCPIIIIVVVVIILLGLGSKNEREHMLSGHLSLAYLMQHDDLQFHPFSYK
jgi:hypothetical protein